MHKFCQVFGGRRVLLPVIHVANSIQANQNAEIAFGAGADGVFLINHSIPSDRLIDAWRLVLHTYPDRWVGMNFLDHDAYNGLSHLPGDIGGYWCDDIGMRERAEYPDQQAARVRSWQRELCLNEMLLFGGVAFKGREHVNDPGRMAKLAMPHLDVVTTSGVRTGSAPDLGKIKAMREDIGDFPLAIASGITRENVPSFLPLADCFLVATGISEGEYRLDYAKVKQLADIIHAY